MLPYSPGTFSAVTVSAVAGMRVVAGTLAAVGNPVAGRSLDIAVGTLETLADDADVVDALDTVVVEIAVAMIGTGFGLRHIAVDLPKDIPNEDTSPLAQWGRISKHSWKGEERTKV